VELFPAIDIRNGRVVRLSQGEAARETVYADDPVAVAVEFAEAGARWIHVVDLDRAFDRGSNDAAVRRIVAEVGDRVRVQLGGGLRTLDRVRDGLALGVSRLVIGTAAATDPSMLAAALDLAPPERLAVGVDARDGFVAIRGWTETSTLRAADVARDVVRLGITTLIYTDVARDGMLQGINWDATIALAEAISIPVIASGGFASMDDIRALLEPRARKLQGAIAGRAIYDGRLNVEEALKLIREAEANAGKER